jgi:uncharacterized OsmC-like protein
MTTVTLRNGVNVTQLVQTVEAIQADPEIARFKFRSHSEWQGGGQTRTWIKGFYGAKQEDTTREKPFELLGDEPPVLLGENAGPNAVEVVLHALASCLSVGFVYNAAAQGIEIEALEFDLEGAMDLRGFLGLSNQVRAGYDGIRVVYRVRANAPREKIEELCQYVQRTSPIVDVLRNPVPVSVELAG